MIRLRTAALSITFAMASTIASGSSFAQNIPTAPVAPVQTAPGSPPVVASPEGDKAAAAKSAAKPAAKKGAGKAAKKKPRAGKAAARSSAKSGAPKN